MTKVLFVTLFLIFILDARENPFFPSQKDKDIPYTSNEDRSLPLLNRAAITLPPQARILQKVTIQYKNLDGSQESKSIKLENSVDWHLPIFISQSYNSSTNKTETETKIETKMKVKVKTEKIKFIKLAHIKYATFYAFDKTLKIITKDKIIRNFLLVQPHRIVLDFKRDTDMKSFIKKNEKNIFTKIKIGNHSGYYRAVIELDGYYRYKTKKIPEGYLFKLR